jgi:hypothetical protein
MGEAATHPDYEALAQRFQRFAETECRGVSPLYEHLALAIAADEEMLAAAAHATTGQPVPNLFLAAVHFLLLQGQDAPLAQFYPSLTTSAAQPAAVYPAFRAFCLAHTAALQHLLTTRRVQTNEVGRCAYLFPAFALVAALANKRPLALIEIGTSAGLNLMWDHYGYRYDSTTGYGDPGSLVQLVCTLHGNNRPPLPERFPEVVLKVGADLQVIDVREPTEALWLRALVWPEHRERAGLLSNAFEIIRRSSPHLVSGDGLQVLPGVLRAVPLDAAVCVFHTHTLNQWAVEARSRLSALLAEHASTRDIYRISA